MLETLKSIRVIHNTLLITSISVFLIAFQGESIKNPYSEAYDEIERFQEIGKTAIYFGAMKFVDINEGTGNRKEMVFFDELLPDIDVDLLMGDEVAGMDFWFGGVYEQYGIPNTFCGYQRVQIDYASYKDSISQWFEQEKRKAHENSVNIIGWKTGEIVGSESGGNLKIVLSTDSQSFSPSSFTINFVGIQNFTEPHPKILKAFKENNIIEETDGQIIFMPKVRKIIDGLGSLKFKDLKYTLKRKAKEFESSNSAPLNLLGFEIPRNEASTIAPAILLSIFLYFFIHVQHLKGLKPDIEIINSFPWMGFYKSKLAIAVFYLTLLLPFVASIAIISGSTFDIWVKVIFWVIVPLLFIWLSICIILEISVIRKSVK